MKTFQKIFIVFFGMRCLLASFEMVAQRYFEPYNCNDYKSFSLRLVNFNEKGDRHLIANDSDMEMGLVHNGEKITIPSKGESKVFNGKATSIFDSCSIYLDGLPMENYNQYIRFYNDMANKVEQLQSSEDFVSKMYGLPDSRNPENLANGIRLAQKLGRQFEDFNKAIQDRLVLGDVSRNFDHYNFLDKLGYTCVTNIGICKRVMDENQTSIDLAKEDAEVKNQRVAGAGKAEEEEPMDRSDGRDKIVFSSDGPDASRQEPTANGGRKGNPNREDGSFVADSQFKDNLNGVKQGEYFMDGNGNYYQKAPGGAKRVDRITYEKQAADEIYAQMEQDEMERQYRDAKFKQDWDNISTSFYAMSTVRNDMREASDLSGHFESVEQLNEVFFQKMREISQMGLEMQQASLQGVQAYSSVLSSTSSGYDYSGFTNAIGSIASVIASNKAQEDAREKLRRQRAAQEAEIKERQLQALLSIRTEIGNTFKEGGMPLSSHKVEAPVLYLFAYGKNTDAWNRDQYVDMGISNVIRVYRYGDGTYPFTSQVRRIFENAGIPNPVLIGYFVNKDEAEKYRASLLEVAPIGKFNLQDIQLKESERTITAGKDRSSGTDFWETRSSGADDGERTGTDFWGISVKDKKAENKNTGDGGGFWDK